MKVCMKHTGTKRGGWNVQWWLETRRYDGGDFISPEEAVKLGFAPHSYYWATLGPFSTRAEVERKARELGLEPITRQKWARMKNR